MKKTICSVALCTAVAVVLFSGCGTSVPKTNASMNKYELIRLFPRSEWRESGAYFWDEIKEKYPIWKDLKYKWIAESTYGDQVILTENSPLHNGPAIYIHGPDIAGPRSKQEGWFESILYMGSSVEEWHARIAKYGDEHSIGPGGIEREIENPEEYRKIYRALNPGLGW